MLARLSPTLAALLVALSLGACSSDADDFPETSPSASESPRPEPTPTPSDEDLANQAAQAVLDALSDDDCDTVMDLSYYEPGDEDEAAEDRKVCEQGHAVDSGTAGDAVESTLQFVPEGTDAQLDVPITFTRNGETDDDLFFMVRVNGRWLFFPN